MAKGVGLIGNFKGKVGNMIAYNITDSNNNQTQGVRVYQPVVKNPRTYDQALQRAKIAPVNKTYDVLKNIIIKGQEGIQTGNKSRLAWISNAIKKFNGPWFEKGELINLPALVAVTSGSLNIDWRYDTTYSWLKVICNFDASAISSRTSWFTQIVMAEYPALKEGDILTFLSLYEEDGVLKYTLDTLTLSLTNDESIPTRIHMWNNSFGQVVTGKTVIAFTVIVARPNANSSNSLSVAIMQPTQFFNKQKLNDAAKEKSIISYMDKPASTDWREDNEQ